MPKAGLWHPKHWPVWLLLFLLWLLTHLPYAWQMHIGKALGMLTGKLAKRRRRIASINLRLCFPELNETQRQTLVQKHFVSLGMGFMEMAMAWWVSDRRLKHLGKITGQEHLQTALQRGKGVILLSAHFTPLELSFRFLLMHQAIHAVYRPHEHPVIEHTMVKQRSRYVEKAIPREAVRDMLRSLKANKALWFAPDQNFGHKGSVFADFFGIPAATNTATARLARITGAVVVPFFMRRLEQGGYLVELLPALEGFPCGDDVKDAQTINRVIENAVRQAPEQYFWMHRRFKDRPPGEERFY